MKYIITVFLTGFLLSCSNEIDLLEPGETIPVVYGIINPDDSIQKIRLTRTFDGSYTPGVDAKVSDSLYFRDARIYLELRSDQGEVLERLKLEQAIIEDREDGVFATTPNIIFIGRDYQIRRRFNSEIPMIYHLTINLPDYDKSIFATAEIPSRPKISTNIDEKEELNIYNYFQHPKVVMFQPGGEFVSELIIEFFYENQIGGQWYRESFVYKRESAPASRIAIADSIKFTPEWLFQQFAGRITDNPDVMKRRFNSLEIRSIRISPEYHYYSSSLEYSPDYYTNIFSNIVNGKGLFAAYSKSEMKGITFGREMLDSLALGKLTRHLRFERVW